MNLIPWKRSRETSSLMEPSTPATAILRLRDEMDRMFEGFLNGGRLRFADTAGMAREYLPALDIEDNDDRIVLRAEVPGVAPDDINVSITGNTLTISGEKQESSERKEGSCWHSERRFGSFKRLVELPADVDAQSVSAEHDNGVVTITVNRKPGAKPRTVPVKSGSLKSDRSRALASVG